MHISLARSLLNMRDNTPTSTQASSECVSILPSGKLCVSLEPWDKLFAQSMGQGLYALLFSPWELGESQALFFLKSQIRQHFTRVAHAAILPNITMVEALKELLPTQQECLKFIEQIPPITGEEYLHAEVIRQWFFELSRYIENQLTEQNLSISEWLKNLGEPWNQLGKVFFHLAENKDDTSGTKPFAFLATVAHQSNADDQVRHLPLHAAIKLYGNHHPSLLSLLQPLQKAASHSPFLQHLLDSKKIYLPQAWSALDAYQFLQDSSQFEQSGIIVRMVNLWKKSPPKLQLAITAETKEEGTKSAHATGVSVHSLLRFSIHSHLVGQELSEEELNELLAQGTGLIRFKGEWIQIDSEKIRQLMSRWQYAIGMMNRMGIPLVQGLRILVGGKVEKSLNLPESDDDCQLLPGKHLENFLMQLRNSSSISSILPDDYNRLLRPYQIEGVAFLYKLTSCGLGACLADDMGLGKTLQAIVWLDILRRSGELEQNPALIVVPASLLNNWKEEIARFAPDLSLCIYHGAGRQKWHPASVKCKHILITTYDVVRTDEELASLTFSAIILDEAQAIKNVDSARARAVMGLQSSRRVALSGTPIENNLLELWSLMEFLNPGLCGSKKGFREFTSSLQGNFAPLRKLVRPFILRRMKSDPQLIPDLPDKIEVPVYCSLSSEQVALYHSQIQLLHSILDEPDPSTRIRLILPILARLKQICNHPAQFQGTEDYLPERSGKFKRLKELCASIAARQEKVLIFTQFRSIIPYLHELVSEVFSRTGLTIHGDTPIGQRQNIVSAFQQETGPPFCILSLRAAGTGLTLTQASHVIHFDRWWNPAVENQASDRAYRIGQHRNVMVHKMICQGTIEERIEAMLYSKKQLASDLFDVQSENWLASLSSDELRQLLCETIV